MTMYPTEPTDRSTESAAPPSVSNAPSGRLRNALINIVSPVAIVCLVLIAVREFVSLPPHPVPYRFIVIATSSGFVLPLIWMFRASRTSLRIRQMLVPVEVVAWGAACTLLVRTAIEHLLAAIVGPGSGSYLGTSVYVSIMMAVGYTSWVMVKLLPSVWTAHARTISGIAGSMVVALMLLFAFEDFIVSTGPGGSFQAGGVPAASVPCCATTAPVPATPKKHSEQSAP